jgi:hypothetical protein
MAPNNNQRRRPRHSGAYQYEFTAPADAPAAELEEFLRGVEKLAQSLGFSPTTVLNIPFDTLERREFARRLGGGFSLQNDQLRDLALPREGQIREYDPVSGIPASTVLSTSRKAPLFQCWRICSLLPSPLCPCGTPP